MTKNTSNAVGTFFRITALALTLVLGVGTSCLASIQMTFDNSGPTTGTIQYDGEGGSLIGTSIGFDQLTGLSTPANSGVILDIENGELNFTTGANTNEAPSSWTFAGGGSFTLTGSAFDGANLIASGTLLSGSFTTASAFSGGGSIIVIGLGIDEKNPDLLDFFGIGDPNQFIFANTEIAALIGSIGANGGFSANVLEADITNTQVPEASTIAVWSVLSLLGMGAAYRKRSN